MGESDRYIDFRQKSLWKLNSTDACIQLIYVNAIFFVILLFIQVGFLFGDKELSVFYETIIGQLAIPAVIGDLVYKPWTLFTHGFTDIGANLFTVLINLVWLYFFGKILELTTSSRSVIPVYIYGVAVSGLFFILASLFLPPSMLTRFSFFGAQSGVMALAVAATILLPRYKVFPQIRGGLSLWILTSIYVLLELLGSKEKGLAQMFGIFGAVSIGAVFAFYLKKGIDISNWMNKFYYNIQQLFRTPNKNNSTDKVFYKTGNRVPFEKEPIVTQNKIDIILDKISATGYGSLTAKEKAILKQQANHND